ncbi:MAG: ACT domain-containing protein [Arenicellales bacterium]|nr:ACT domain-containing protein [Arenicellales bacterium]MDP6289317.1 ACT domain-containing protein [Arenicellales bacterium]MDP6434280.1 ACT domain-containing protein [Arenicellales bacterium]MDP6671791.1 ACT domain-containing protein [Arenicellales bacterium]MDP6723926.1 ACT domain-containing protein [Arenicellales bacterium]
MGSIVFTFVGKDRPGLVEKVSKVVSDNNGNWLESRLVKLGGRFAGIVEVDVSSVGQQALLDDLSRLESEEILVVAASNTWSEPEEKSYQCTLSLLGNDRPGIVQEIAAAMADRKINILSLESDVTSAPMVGSLMFTASAVIEIPKTIDVHLLEERLEEIGSQFHLDIKLEEEP